MNFKTIFALLQNNQKKGFVVEDAYIFLAFFASIFLLTYLVYNFDKSYNKKLYLKEVLLSPILHTIIFFTAIILLNNNFGKAAINNDNLIFNDYCQKQRYQVYKKAINYAENESSIIEYENAYKKFIKNAGCHIYKNDYLKDLEITFKKVKKNKLQLLTKRKFVTFVNAVINNKFSNAITTINNFNLSEEKYFNYYVALANFQKKNYETAIFYFEKHKLDIAIHPNYYKNFANCINNYKGTKGFTKQFYNNKLLNELNILDKAAITISKKDVYKFFELQINHLIKHTNFKGFLIAILVYFVWLIYLNYINVYNNTSLKKIFLSIVISIFCIAIFSLVFSTLFTVFVKPLSFFKSFPYWFQYLLKVGFVKEAIKIAPVLLIFAFTNYLKDPFNFILHASTSALTFTFFENIFYFSNVQNSIFFYKAFVETIVQFGLSTIAIGGFIFHYSNKNKIISYTSLLSFFCFASILQGFYYILTQTALLNLFIISLFAKVIILFFIIYYFQILANNAINFSEKFTHYKRFSFYKLKYLIIFALAAIFAFEYLSIGFNHSKVASNHFFKQHFIFVAVTIFIVNSTMFNFDFVKKYWKGFTIYNKDAESTIYRSGAFAFLDLFTLRILFANKTPHNYVGYKILFEPYNYNNNLMRNLAGIRKAEIIDRKVIIPFGNSSVSNLGDPFWFVIKLEIPIKINAENKNYFLMRFRESDPKFDNCEAQLAHLFYRPDFEWLDKNVLVLSDLNDLGWIDVGKILD